MFCLAAPAQMANLALSVCPAIALSLGGTFVQSKMNLDSLVVSFTERENIMPISLLPRHAGGRAATAGLLVLAATALLSTASPAQAQLALTSSGTALGFSLSTFVSGFSSDGGNVGPLGIAFPSTGGVLVTETFGNVYHISDTDGQTAASLTAAQNYGYGNATGLAAVGSKVYMTQRSNGDLVQINPSGTFNQNIVGLPLATGVVANPANGHLFVSDTSNTIFDVNPISKTATPFVTGIDFDGLSLSPDGNTLYGAADQTGHILGFSILSGLQTFDSGYIPGGVDGTAAGSRNLAGNVFVNTNSGTVVEVNLATDAQTLIASGGSRGDFVTADPSNGTLLLTQSDRIIRLTPGSGGGFGPVPEASTTVSFGLMLAIGGVGFYLSARKRARKAK